MNLSKQIFYDKEHKFYLINWYVSEGHVTRDPAQDLEEVSNVLVKAMKNVDGPDSDKSEKVLLKKLQSTLKEVIIG